MSSALDSVNSLLLAGGVQSFKFDQPGDMVKGIITNAVDQQQTDFKTGELKFYKDGKPMMQIAITLQTADRDPQNPDDDGLRRIFAKGQMLAAIGDAVRKAQAKLELDGTLAVKYEREEEPTERGLNGKKIYVAAYQPPAPTAGANDLLNAGAAPAPQQQSAASVSPADLLG